MKTQPLPSVDVQILCDAFQPIGGLELEAAILMAALAQGIPENGCKLLDNSTEADKRFLCGNFHVLVTQSIPFEKNERLNLALNTFPVRSTFPDAAEVVNTTQHCISISVKKSLLSANILPAAAHEFVLSDDTAFNDSAETWTALEIARIISCALFSKARARAVFWGPSVYLLKPETFDTIAKVGHQNFLYMQPEVIGHVDPDSGEQHVGIIGVGSPWLIGYTLEIKPCALPPGYLAELIFAFLTFTQRSGKLIAGDVFGRDENEKVKVIAHEEAEGHPASLELKVVHNPKLGITQDDFPTIYKQYDGDGRVTKETVGGAAEVDLDPTDPVDAAILEHLQTINTDEKTPPSAVSEEESERAFADLETPSAPIAVELAPKQPEFSRRTNRPAPPSAKRVSMQELREFAQQAQATSEASEALRPRRGLLGKLFGKKPD